MRTITIRGAILVEIKKNHCWKCIFSGVFHRSVFWHLKRKPAVIFSRYLFFKILWWFHEAHSWVKCRWKNKSIFPTFHWWKIDNTFVTFISNKSLCSNLQNLMYMVYIRLWLYTLNFWSIQYTGLIDFDKTIWLHTQNKMLSGWESHIWNIQSSSPHDLIFIGECPNLASQLSVML